MRRSELARNISKLAVAHAARRPYASVPANIAAVIREKILRGELQPGAHLAEGSLSRELHAGQPTIREALFLLEREGLVRRVPRLGTFVAELDLDDIGQLFQVRGALEGLAAELAARRVGQEAVEELRRRAEEMKACARRHGKWGFFQADLAFHRHLWSLSGNPHLARMLESVVVPLFVFSYMRLERSLEDLETSADSHLAIAEALSRGPAEARAAVEGSVRLFLSRHLASVLDRFLPDGAGSPVAGA